MLLRFLFFFCWIFCWEIAAEVREYQIAIGYKNVQFGGRSVQAIAINNSTPGPVLRFQKGDTARIFVKNLLDVETSVHWHGILLPNDQDGVPNLTNPPIAPGETYVYEFPITHTGTYWYHSHIGLQEQRGVYGAIIIDDLSRTPIPDTEHVLVLSDWTNENPDEVLRFLKRGT